MTEATSEDRLRFWRNTRRSAGCWTWAGAKSPEKWQYGTFHLNGRSYRVNRVAWSFSHGVIPDGLHVLHHCDNTHCVRPDHLFLGRHADNMHDCTAKGRRPRGERCGQAVLTEDLVRLILASSKKTKALAAELGINPETIYKVRQGKSWGWLS